jgi:hypothetical protein
MNEKTKRVIENGGGVVAGAVCGPGAVVAVAGGATDAAAMTTALSALGCGSMLPGFGVVAVVGILGFFGYRSILRRIIRSGS